MPSRFLSNLVFAFFGIACLQAAELPTSPRLHLPEGFTAEKVAGPPECVFPMFATFDDRGRLFVAESSGLDLYAELTALTRKCRVRLLEDSDGDGRFDRSSIFADELVFPMGLAWREEKLFVADPPDLVVYTDRDGDGRADERKVLLSGFGHRDNGSLHGLTFGPDGLLYMTMGDPDGFHLKGPDGSRADGDTGALIRCRSDGSKLEVVSWGFVNLVEVAFMPSGEIIGTDNWFQLPSGGIRDALVHLVEGGVYPLNSQKGGGQVLTGDVLPAIGLYPAVALSGLVRYRGKSFPESMRGGLFSAQHNARGVARHQLLRKGATFESKDEDFVTSDDPDFHPSDVLEDADGTLLIVDTGGWYVQHCPTGKIRDSQAPGGIYRVRRTHAEPVSDPWGNRIDWTNQSGEKLAGLLADPRPAVSDRAQRTMVARGSAAVPALSIVLKSGQEAPMKQQALWALAAISGESAGEELRQALTNADADIASIALRALAMRRDTTSIHPMARMLSASDATLQLAAAEALARCGTSDSLPSLWQALTNAPDDFVRHAVVHAIHKLAGREALELALGHESPCGQAAALWLLDQPPDGGAPKEAVLQRLAAPDVELAKTALQVLKRHVDWADAAAAYAGEALSKRAWTNNDETRLQGLLLAFQSQPKMQEVIAEFLNRSDPQVLWREKLLLLETMRQMTLEHISASWIEAFRGLLQSGGNEVRRAVLRVLSTWQLSSLDSEVSAIADDQNNSVDLRLEALQAMAPREARLSEPRFNFVLEQVTNDQKPLARLAAAEIFGRSRLSADQKTELLKRVQNQWLVSPDTLLPAIRQGEFRNETSLALLQFLKSAIQRGWRPSDSDLEPVLTKLPKAFETEAGKLRSLLHESKEQERARLLSFEPLLSDGNEERGRAVFFGSKVGCSTCHRVDGQGGMVGPDLTKIGAIRAGRDLLESIILPSSTFAQGFESYSLVLKDGREADGLIARQNAGFVVLRDSSGAEQQFRSEQIAELKRRMVSIMPEGLESTMSSDEFRDLLAFLQSLK